MALTATTVAVAHVTSEPGRAGPGGSRTGAVRRGGQARSAASGSGQRSPARPGSAADGSAGHGGQSGPGQGAAGADQAQGAAGADRAQAAAWVSRQVSRSAVVACDPAMAAALRADGVPAGDLLVLGPGAGSDPLGSAIVIATAAVRSEFGTRLARVYAPLVLASFGTGTARIEVRVEAPDGAGAYRHALRSDLLARRAGGAQMLDNARLTVSPAARRALLGGRVDTRLLTTIAALAQLRRLRVAGFCDSGPGTSPVAPLRSAEIALADPGPAAALGPLRSFLAVQRAPFLAARIAVTQLPGGQPALILTFAGPSPLGLLASPAPAPEAGPDH